MEQHVKLALDVSNYAYVMDRGRVAMQGDSIKMKDDPKLLKLLYHNIISIGEKDIQLKYQQKNK